MIISHRHKFIYLKARKVAGTSVEVALAQHCRDGDIVTPIGAFNPKWDEDQYEHPGTRWRGYDRHSGLIPVRRRLGRESWDDYFKFAVIRNPWDLVVSQYHWATRGDVWHRYEGTVGRSLRRFWRKPFQLRKNFIVLGAGLARSFLKIEELTLEFFVTYMLRFYPSNDRFYFDRSGSMGLDFVIRYENLQDDYRSVCERIGVAQSNLPSLKSKSRPERQHYSAYYDDRTREIVAKAYHRHVDHFGYRFEEP